MPALEIGFLDDNDNARIGGADCFYEETADRGAKKYRLLTSVGQPRSAWVRIDGDIVELELRHESGSVEKVGASKNETYGAEGVTVALSEKIDAITDADWTVTGTLDVKRGDRHSTIDVVGRCEK
jgi:hypothetical protein